MSQSPVAGSAASNQFGTFTVRFPSPAQQKFVARLAEQKGVATGHELSAEVAGVAAGTVNLKAASRLIDAMMELPDAPRGGSGFAAVRGASDKQIEFITRLGVERAGGAVYIQTQLDSLRITDIPELSSRDASNLIGVLMEMPKAAPALRVVTDFEAGMYQAADGTIYRVYLGQQSGRMLCKRVVGSIEGGYSYEYVGAASARMPADAARMSLEDAKAWGRMTNTCCVCAASLNDPTSVDAGIGPVCAKRV